MHTLQILLESFFADGGRCGRLLATSRLPFAEAPARRAARVRGCMAPSALNKAFRLLKTLLKAFFSILLLATETALAFSLAFSSFKDLLEVNGPDRCR